MDLERDSQTKTPRIRSIHTGVCGSNFIFAAWSRLRRRPLVHQGSSCQHQCSGMFISFIMRKQCGGNKASFEIFLGSRLHATRPTKFPRPLRGLRKCAAINSVGVVTLIMHDACCDFAYFTLKVSFKWLLAIADQISWLIRCQENLYLQGFGRIAARLEPINRGKLLLKFGSQSLMSATMPSWADLIPGTCRKCHPFWANGNHIGRNVILHFSRCNIEGFLEVEESNHERSMHGGDTTVPTF